MSEKEGRTWSAAVEFYTGLKSRNITTEVRIGDEQTVAWAKLCSTIASAFNKDAVLVARLCEAVSAEAITRHDDGSMVFGENVNLFVLEEEDEDDTQEDDEDTTWSH